MNQNEAWLTPQSAYPIVRLHLEFRVNSQIGLPDYAGSMLRGAFGGALRRTACMTREKDCKACPLYQSCPYTQIFEKPAPAQHSLQLFSAIPNGYIIEPSAWGERVYQRGETLAFSMVLVGQVRQHLPLIIYAWQQAFSYGVGRGTAELTRVYSQSNESTIEIYDLKNNSVASIQEQKVVMSAQPKAAQDICLHFHSPLRLQKNGKALSASSVTPNTLIKAIARRVHLMLEFHTGYQLINDFSQLNGHIQAIENSEQASDKQLQWHDWTRYSSRQKTTMQFGGLMGLWQLHQVSPALMHLIELGAQLHIGKETTFGMGGYTLQ